MSHVFISYKGEEESWAARVASTLQSFGVPVWRDHAMGDAAIQTGDRWRPALELAVRQSSHMIVMWSQKLKGDATSVAHQEIGMMQQLIDKRGKGSFIPLLLDDAPIEKHWSLAPYQGEISLKPLYAKAGPAGADTIRDTDWYPAMLRLLKLFKIRNVFPVRYVVGAMTNAQATNLRDNPAVWAQDVGAYEAVRDLREKTVPFDPKQYGDTPDDWKPFSHLPEMADSSIGELIIGYDQARRRYTIEGGKKPNWILVSYSSEMLSADPADRKKARDEIEKKCLVVLDPMSLLHKDVYKNLVTNWGLQGRSNAFVIGLASCAYQLHADFRNALPDLAKRMTSLLETPYAKFAEPFEPDDQCVLEVGHQFQFARWLQVGADAIIEAQESPLRSKMNSAFRRRVRESVPLLPSAELVDMPGPGEKT